MASPTSPQLQWLICCIAGLKTRWLPSSLLAQGSSTMITGTRTPHSLPLEVKRHSTMKLPTTQSTMAKRTMMKHQITQHNRGTTRRLTQGLKHGTTRRPTQGRKHGTTRRLKQGLKHGTTRRPATHRMRRKKMASRCAAPLSLTHTLSHSIFHSRSRVFLSRCATSIHGPSWSLAGLVMCADSIRCCACFGVQRTERKGSVLLGFEDGDIDA